MTFQKGNQMWKSWSNGTGISHRKGLNIEQEYGIEKARVIKEKLRCKRPSMKGTNNPSKRLNIIEKIRQKALGRKHSIETIKRLSKLKQGIKNPNWMGGKSFEPYSLEFKQSKEILVKDKCFLCGEKHNQIHIHHIDYDKKNSNINNLIPLCRKCHGKTNFNRVYWESFFKSFYQPIVAQTVATSPCSLEVGN